MEPQFYYLTMVVVAFVLFLSVITWLQISDENYRRLQRNKK